MIVYYNGQYLQKSEVAVSPDDRGFLFADGRRTRKEKVALVCNREKQEIGAPKRDPRNEESPGV